jgi:hypothetical protein
MRGDSDGNDACSSAMRASGVFAGTLPFFAAALARRSLIAYHPFRIDHYPERMYHHDSFLQQ